MTYQPLSPTDKGSPHGEFTSQLFLVDGVSCLGSNSRREAQSTARPGQGAAGLCSHAADRHSGESRARAKMAATVETGVKQEVKGVRNR